MNFSVQKRPKRSKGLLNWYIYIIFLYFFFGYTTKAIKKIKKKNLQFREAHKKHAKNKKECISFRTFLAHTCLISSSLLIPFCSASSAAKVARFGFGATFCFGRLLRDTPTQCLFLCYISLITSCCCCIYYFLLIYLLAHGDFLFGAFYIVNQPPFHCTNCEFAHGSGGFWRVLLCL